MTTSSRSRSSRALAWVLTAASTVAVATSLSSTASAAVPAGGGSVFTESLGNRFLDPNRVYSTDVRWWLGEAANTDDSLLEEIQAQYDGGFRGVELAMQGDNAAPDALYAYGFRDVDAQVEPDDEQVSRP